MKKRLLATAAATATMLAVGSQAHEGEKHGASAPKATTPAKAADGHSHAAGHAHGDAGAVGAPGDKAKVTRTVHVDMTDSMRFIPASIAARQGETVRFIVRNSGQVKHEFVLGTDKELKAHYALMKKFPEMEHADANQVTVAPGKTGEVIWQFTKAGKIDFACLQPGHYDAGMKGVVNVSAGAARKADAHGDHKH